MAHRKQNKTIFLLAFALGVEATNRLTAIKVKKMRKNDKKERQARPADLCISFLFAFKWDPVDVIIFLQKGFIR